MATVASEAIKEPSKAPLKEPPLVKGLPFLGNGSFRANTANLTLSAQF